MLQVQKHFPAQGLLLARGLTGKTLLKTVPTTSIFWSVRPTGGGGVDAAVGVVVGGVVDRAKAL